MFNSRFPSSRTPSSRPFVLSVTIISPVGIISGEAFGVHTVLRGTVTLLPNGIASQERFGTMFIYDDYVGVTIINSFITGQNISLKIDGHDIKLSILKYPKIIADTRDNKNKLYITTHNIKTYITKRK